MFDEFQEAEQLLERLSMQSRRGRYGGGAVLEAWSRQKAINVCGVLRMFEASDGCLMLFFWTFRCDMLIYALVIRNAGLSGSVRFDSSRLTHLHPLNTPIRAAENVTGASWWMGYSCLILQARSRCICFHS